MTNTKDFNPDYPLRVSVVSEGETTYLQEYDLRDNELKDSRYVAYKSDEGQGLEDFGRLRFSIQKLKKSTTYDHTSDVFLGSSIAEPTGLRDILQGVATSRLNDSYLVFSEFGSDATSDSIAVRFVRLHNDDDPEYGFIFDGYGIADGLPLLLARIPANIYDRIEADLFAGKVDNIQFFATNRNIGTLFVEENSSYDCPRKIKVLSNDLFLGENDVPQNLLDDMRKITCNNFMISIESQEVFLSDHHRE